MAQHGIARERDNPSGVRGLSPVRLGGNLTFGLGIVFILSAITYGIQPYGDDVMAWTSPRVLTLFGLGLLSFASPITSR